MSSDASYRKEMRVKLSLHKLRPSPRRLWTGVQAIFVICWYFEGESSQAMTSTFLRRWVRSRAHGLLTRHLRIDPEIEQISTCCVTIFCNFFFRSKHGRIHRHQLSHYSCTSSRILEHTTCSSGVALFSSMPL